MSQDKEKPNQIGITKEDLAALVGAAVEAARKPNVLEQQTLDVQAATLAARQKERVTNSENILADIERKRWTQQTCSHEHSDGNTHCVYIQEQKGPGYILCQLNQCIIRSGTAAPNYKGTVIYDTNLFNKLFQKCGNRELLFS